MILTYVKVQANNVTQNSKIKTNPFINAHKNQQIGLTNHVEVDMLKIKILSHSSPHVLAKSFELLILV